MKPTHAYILIEALPAKSVDLVAEIRKLPGIRNVHLVTGPYDVIVDVEAPDLKTVGDMVVGKIRATGFVARTVTCIVVDED
ncbi:hypothetical protein A2276_03870 [candidate division WOR-1 bacterium RIFOXYA12_FULL_43_27]|uniref:Transcription regulator AsnC/Lrp ligand binding domain-containing protein n=1 Tax=candidate division WOR-1 bacterium RIFOXYC2_FULL_46_14 TaxID=1802587 RepID=A0A1F4U7F8_UNCSA|nr:MAG: hypothetical protein A2276_03870 [candidate division WOR-1 bacterium RIFOXYA12_FULL_43_27]OGC19169.1 MAG: hypothetical protein A2292_00465 [candidate division WOR-1 bacterium RIFOXYB2_FULL_46_45]OGC30158.1 MAG: hypothetical protein A2232_00465 [candidate division WOR-1 bacterium RIFOXYA2_FULL_46_56]OGC40760.1 MAG: hypothetical protein A2438_00470 [candidate division WOR-1 bacterium RIFOXYC2_FULL_46_14]